MANDKPTDIALLLAALRKSSKLSLRKVAQAVGVSHSVIQQYEQSRLSPPDEALVKLAAVFGTIPEQLFYTARRLTPAAKAVVRKLPGTADRVLQDLADLDKVDREAVLDMIRGLRMVRRGLDLDGDPAV